LVVKLFYLIFIIFNKGFIKYFIVAMYCESNMMTEITLIAFNFEVVIEFNYFIMKNIVYHFLVINCYQKIKGCLGDLKIIFRIENNFNSYDLKLNDYYHY
jgi:hypothetical protein